MTARSAPGRQPACPPCVTLSRDYKSLVKLTFFVTCVTDLF